MTPARSEAKEWEEVGATTWVLLLPFFSLLQQGHSDHNCCFSHNEVGRATTTEHLLDYQSLFGAEGGGWQMQSYIDTHKRPRATMLTDGLSVQVLPLDHGGFRLGLFLHDCCPASMSVRSWWGTMYTRSQGRVCSQHSALSLPMCPLVGMVRFTESEKLGWKEPQDSSSLAPQPYLNHPGQCLCNLFLILHKQPTCTITRHVPAKHREHSSLPQVQQGDKGNVSVLPLQGQM